MPQMAPIMWSHSFVLITLLLMTMVSTIYFTANKLTNKVTLGKSSLVLYWLW